MSSQVDGREAQPRVETCVLCGERFADVASLDVHWFQRKDGRCRDPFMMTLDGDEDYMFDYDPKVSPVVWSLAQPKAAS